MTPQTNVVIVAYRDDKNEMVPVARNGTLALFPTIARARKAAGALGVAAPTRWAQVEKLCRIHGLELPERPDNGKVGQLALFEERR